MSLQAQRSRCWDQILENADVLKTVQQKMQMFADSAAATAFAVLQREIWNFSAADSENRARWRNERLGGEIFDCDSLDYGFGLMIFDLSRLLTLASEWLALPLRPAAAPVG